MGSSIPLLPSVSFGRVEITQLLSGNLIWFRKALVMNGEVRKEKNTRTTFRFQMKFEELIMKSQCCLLH